MKQYNFNVALGCALSLVIKAALFSMLAWAPAAHATGGLCKWEGGPGTAVSCLNEDCLEDGGLAICAAPELRPLSGLNDQQVDADKFSYSMCDMAGPSIPRIARWCAAEGGTWVVSGSSQSCLGLPSQYPGVGSAANEGAAVAASDQYLALQNSSSCTSSLDDDTGWGLSDPGDQSCDPAGDSTQNGMLLHSQRKRTYSYKPNPPCTGGGRNKISKYRRLTCPIALMARTKPSGDLQCYLPSCVKCLPKVGNPVDVATGAKLQTEVDYRSADGIEFARYYNSQSRYRPRDAGPFVSVLGDYWRTSYSRRLLVISGNAYVSAVIQDEDGSLRFFNASGAEILNSNGAAERMQSLGGSGWRVTRANSDVEEYDAAGRLATYTTRAGVVTTINYFAGRMSSIVNSFGRTLSLGYDSNGRLTSLTLPDGQQILYSYDTLGRQTGVTYADSTSRTYHYEDPNNSWLLTGITDERAVRFATYQYSSLGLMQSEEHAGGVNRYTFSFSNPLQDAITGSYTDPIGRNRSYSLRKTAGVFRVYDSSLYCPDCSNIRNAQFDANGNYSAVWDLNNRQTTYIFDQTRNLETSRTEAAGTSNQRTITTTWHPTFRQPATITEPNRTTSYTHDANGNVLTTTITDTSVSPNVSRVWTRTYDSFGRVLTVDGPRTDVSDVTTYTYYNCASGYECGQIHTVTNALNQTTTFNTYNADGQPLTITDPNGVTTAVTYDARQRVTSTQTGAETTTFQYWPTGLLKKVTQFDGSYLLYTYDDAHRLTTIEDNLGNRISYTLDGQGNRTSEKRSDSSGALRYTQTRIYNELSQLWQVLTSSGADAEATILTYDLQGNQTVTSAPMGRTTTNTYDELNRLRQFTDPANGVTKYDFDANDNLTKVTDPRNLATTYTYNGFGELKTRTSPDTGVTTNTYDSGGNVLTSTDARGAVRTSTYDAANRLTSVAFSSGGTVDQTITYTYDAGTYGKGRLTGASDASHSLSWTYDALGRVINKTQVVNGITKSIGYGYSSGRLSSITLPSGGVVTYGYNSSGQVASVTLNGTTTILNGALYEPFGPISGWNWGNGTLAVRTYDVDGRVTQIDSAGFSSYSYFEDGSIKSRLDDTPSSYSLPNGTSTLSVASTSNRVTGAAGALVRTYSYDNAGNVSSFSGTTFAYNYANRMKSSTQGGVTTSYTYDALGERVRKSGPSGSTLFVYDEAGHLVGEYDGTGALIQETIWMGEIPVATLRPIGGSVSVFYVHTDHLNTPRRVSSAANNSIVWRWDSDPFGAALPNQDPDGDSVSFVYNLRFPGQYYDGESGLSYNYARDYDPAVGRYVESDPVGLGGGLNTYAYAHDNPIAFSDPFGLAVCDGRWRKMGELIPTYGSPGWQTLPSGACKCFWLCMPCSGQAMYGDVYSLPSSWGRTVVLFGGKVNPGSGGIRPTPSGPAGGPSATMGGSTACVCSKPGPELGCTQCYPHSPWQ